MVEASKKDQYYKSTSTYTFAVADKTERPLYRVDAHDLEPKNLNNNLKDIMNVASEWGAIVLIDGKIFIASVLFHSTLTSR